MSSAVASLPCFFARPARSSKRRAGGTRRAVDPCRVCAVGSCDFQLRLALLRRQFVPRFDVIPEHNQGAIGTRLEGNKQVAQPPRLPAWSLASCQRLQLLRRKDESAHCDASTALL